MINILDQSNKFLISITIIKKEPDLLASSFGKRKVCCFNQFI